MDKQKREKFQMLPSLQYLQGSESNLSFGRTVGLEGKQLERLTKYRKRYRFMSDFQNLILREYF